MRNRISFIISLLLCLCPIAMQAQLRYEYWLDTDETPVVKNGNENLSFSLPLNELEPGMHTLRILITDAENNKTCTSYLFMLNELTSKFMEENNPVAATLESWFDNDFASRTRKKLSKLTVSELMDASALNPGMHIFHARILDAEGKSVDKQSYLFMLNELTSTFEAEAELSSKTLEYWLDQNFESRKAVRLSSNRVSKVIDISSLTPGLHYLHTRTLDAKGITLDNTSYLFCLNGYSSFASENMHGITSYSYAFDGRDIVMEMLDEEMDVFELRDFEVEIPKAPYLVDFSKSKLTFADGNICVADSVGRSFELIIYQDGRPCAVPIKTTFNTWEQLTKEIRPIVNTRSLTIDKNTEGRIEAFSFTVEDMDKYYITTDQECKINLYDKEGTYLSTLTHEDIMTSSVSLEPSMYYGVVYDMLDDSDNTLPQTKLRITRTKNFPLGDVNYDGDVNVGDIAGTANIILQTDDDLNEERADINEDANVDVWDLSAIAYYIINDRFPEPRAQMAKTEARAEDTPSLTLDNFYIWQGEEMLVNIYLNQPDKDVQSLQFDLCLPQGFHLAGGEDDVTTTSGNKNHTLRWSTLQDGTVRFVDYAVQGKTFSKENADILSIRIIADDDIEPGEYELLLRNVSIVKSDFSIVRTESNAVAICLGEDEQPTGIGSIKKKSGNTFIYDLQGRRIKSVQKGIYIIDGKKTLVK